MIQPGEIVVDNFAGGGGASTGLSLGLNRHVDIAINHDSAAIDMHKVNHPEAKHYCESVWDVDPIEACNGRPVGLAWFSPDCKHFSKAKGGTPVDKNIRGLAWVAVRWASLVSVRMFMLENVEEFMSWGPVVEVEPGKFKPCPERKGETFDGFIKALSTGLGKEHPAYKDAYQALFRCKYDIRQKLNIYKKIKHGLGYQIDFKILSACDYGTPTTRKRLFLVARNDGEPIQWPIKTHGPKGSGLTPFKTAADIIDWDIPVKSIFGRKKPLADNTLKRIAKGLQKFVIDNPDPFIIRIGQTGFGGDRLSYGLDTPLTTVTSKAEHILVAPFIERQFGNSAGNDVNEPLGTVTAGGGGKSALITSHMIKMRGTSTGHKTDDPVHTISAGGFHIGEVRAFMVKYYGTNIGHSINEPLQTVTTKHRFALVTVSGENYQIVDIGMRMLEPHELFAAQGFPEDYKISHDSSGKKVSKASQVARCGNAVCPPVAQALVEANIMNSQCGLAA